MNNNHLARNGGIHMKAKLPASPAEVLDISTFSLKMKIVFKVFLARMFGFWKYPYKEAGASTEEMTMKDIFYWVYKSSNPITKMEKGQKNSLMSDATIVGLPLGFKKKSSLTMGAGGDLLQAEGLEHSKDILFNNISDLLFEPDISY